MIAIIGCLMTGLLSAQSSRKKSGKSTYTKVRHGSNPIRMPKSKAKIICPVFQNSTYPYHGLGVKLGDPFAITYKYYASEKFGVVADFGKASSGLYNRYYREQFDQYVVSDTLSGEAEIDYLTHMVNADWVAEIRLLRHFDAKGITPGLKAYIGAGAELKNTKLMYQYLYNSDPNGNNNVNSLGQFDERRVTFGPQITCGIEYSYFQIPISAFMEIEMYMDVSQDPGWRTVQGGAGLRYIFR
jgi:hypothetical protein